MNLCLQRNFYPLHSDLQHDRILKYPFIYFVLKANTKFLYLGMDKLLFLRAITASVPDTPSPSSDHVKRARWCYLQVPKGA